MHNKDLHILFVSSWFPSSKFPFNGNFVIRHAEAVAHFAKVSFANITSDPLLDKEKLGISPKIKIFEKVLRKSYNVPGLSLIWNGVVKFYYFWKLYKEISKLEGKPDVIHANVLYPSAFYGWFLKIFTKTPFLVSEHWTGYLNEKGNALGVAQRRIYNILASKAFAICPVSEFLKDGMIKSGIKGNYLIVPNVVDTNLFKPKPEILSKKKFKFVHISSLIDEHKNITGLINIIDKLKRVRDDFELHIITCSSDKSWEKITLDKNLHDSIFFHYSYSPEEVADFLKSCDVFLLTSNYETFGVVIIESFAAGIPVISTDIGPSKSLINSERGFCVEKGNEQKYLEVILEFMNDNKKFNSEEIRKFAVNNFSYEAVGERFIEIYQSALNQK